MAELPGEFFKPLQPNAGMQIAASFWARVGALSEIARYESKYIMLKGLSSCGLLPIISSS